MDTDFNTERRRKQRVARALQEIQRICAKAGEEGWRVAEENDGSQVRMTFVELRTGRKVIGKAHGDRKCALAGACKAMVEYGFI